MELFFSYARVVGPVSIPQRDRLVTAIRTQRMHFNVSKNILRRCRLTGLAVVAAFLVSSFVCGCAGNRMTLKVKSDAEANNRQPVALVVRAVNYNSFLTESYQDVAQKVYANPPDTALLDSRILLPGQKEKLTFEMPGKDLVGIYCLFSRPHTWKEILRRPFNKKYRIIIKENDIIVDKRGFWGRLFRTDIEE